MKTLSILILVSAGAFAQSAPDTVAQGEKIFNQTCATGYCHGVKGAAGGAPRLVGRGFNQAYINTTVTRGITATAMPAFATTLNRRDLSAVVAYVARLNGVSGLTSASGPAPPKAPALSPDAARGHDLFFEAARSFGRCATCHEVNGMGIPVATPIALVPSYVSALRTLATPHVRTATVGGETIPALVVSEGKRRTILYDLTSPPPVQLSLDPADVKLAEGSNWKHASAMSSYTDSELASILTWLKTVIR